MQISTGLPRSALRTLEAPEVATQGEYRLPRAIYQCSKPVTDSQREATTSSKIKNGPAHQLTVPRMRTVECVRHPHLHTFYLLNTEVASP